jgi:hypothetical protein
LGQGWYNAFLWLLSHYCSNSGLFFKNLVFILLFLNKWTLTFRCFRLKNLVLDFRVSNHCCAFQSLFWLSKLPSNHSATVTTLLNALSDLLLLVVGSLVVFVLREYILKVHILVSSEHKLCQIWKTCFFKQIVDFFLQRLLSRVKYTNYSV